MSLRDTTSLFAHTLPNPVKLSQDMLVYAAPGHDISTLGSALSVCAIGAFDGLHLGHRSLIAAAVKDAQTNNALSLVVTFDPDPSCILTPQATEQALLSVQERIQLMLSLGIDAVVCVKFTREFAAKSYQTFVSEYLKDELCCASIHVGCNFRMGAGGKGSAEALESFASKLGIAVHCHELEVVLGHPVSATRIRSLIRAGQVEPVKALLGRPHMVSGVVEHGRGQGASFGFPTANIRTNKQVCLPAEGVYAAYVGDGNHMWPAAVNVGAPRTFGGMVGVPLLEATLLGFEGNLYDKKLFCCFDTWLRGPEHFPTIEKLERTVLDNISWVRDNLGEGELDADD